MDVDIALSDLPIDRAEAESANAANGAVSLDAQTARLWIALVGINGNSVGCPLDQWGGRGDFVWRGEVCGVRLDWLALAFVVSCAPVLKEHFGVPEQSKADT